MGTSCQSTRSFGPGEGAYWNVHARDPYGGWSDGGVWSFTVRPNAAPTADILVTGGGLSWTLDATRSSDPDDSSLTYAWSIDHTYGTREAEGPIVQQQYACDGEYQTRLEVRDPYGGYATASAMVSPRDPRDNDGDGLPACREAMIGTSDADWDTDKDGLSDLLESPWYGARVETFCHPSGAPCMQPHPTVRDVFVEMAKYEGFELYPDVLQKLRSRFASRGIYLHVDNGEYGGADTIVGHPYLWLSDAEKVREALVAPHRRGFFHLGVLACGEPGDETAGLAQRFQTKGAGSAPGYTFVLYQCNYGALAQPSKAESLVFQHELGHNLLGRFYDEGAKGTQCNSEVGRFHNDKLSHFRYHEDEFDCDPSRPGPEYHVHATSSEDLMHARFWETYLQDQDFAVSTWDALRLNWPASADGAATCGGPPDSVVERCVGDPGSLVPRPEDLADSAAWEIERAKAGVREIDCPTCETSTDTHTYDEFRAHSGFEETGAVVGAMYPGYVYAGELVECVTWYATYGNCKLRAWSTEGITIRIDNGLGVTEFSAQLYALNTQVRIEGYARDGTLVASKECGSWSRCGIVADVPLALVRIIGGFEMDTATFTGRALWFHQKGPLPPGSLEPSAEASQPVRDEHDFNTLTNGHYVGRAYEGYSYEGARLECDDGGPLIPGTGPAACRAVPLAYRTADGVHAETNTIRITVDADRRISHFEGTFSRGYYYFTPVLITPVAHDGTRMATSYCWFGDSARCSLDAPQPFAVLELVGRDGMHWEMDDVVFRGKRVPAPNPPVEHFVTAEEEPVEWRITFDSMGEQGTQWASHVEAAPFVFVGGIVQCRWPFVPGTQLDADRNTPTSGDCAMAPAGAFGSNEIRRETGIDTATGSPILIHAPHDDVEGRFYSFEADFRVYQDNVHVTLKDETGAVLAHEWCGYPVHCTLTADKPIATVEIEGWNRYWTMDTVVFKGIMPIVRA